MCGCKSALPRQPLTRRSLAHQKLTLTPFSPAAEITLRLSNCSAVTPWSYLIVSEMPPVRRSHICFCIDEHQDDMNERQLRSDAHQDGKKICSVTYPYSLVQAPTDHMNLVKLETSHGTRMTDKCPMCLTCAHVPHPHRAVPAPTHERVLP